MALPASGTISFQDFNIQRGQASPYQQTIDMATAATLFGVSYNTSGTNPASMDEFYGKGVGTPPTPAPTPSPTPPPTPAPTPAATPAPTPAPTPPPLAVYNGMVTCAGSTGGWRSTFNGGSGTYSYVAYDTSQANVDGKVRGTGGTSSGVRTTPSGGALHDWSGVPNGLWWVAVMDSSGGVSVQNTAVNVSCSTPPPPTPSPTPAPTPPPVYYITLSSGTSACNAKQNWSNV